MTVPQPTQGDAPVSRRARRILLVVGVTAVIGLIALAALVWYIFFRPAGPPPVGPDAPIIPEGWLRGSSILALAINALG